MEEAQREGMTWREVKRLAQTEVAGKASWKPFASTQETIGSDDDDIYAIRSSMQLHRFLVESPFSLCGNVNYPHVSATQGHHLIYKTIRVNCYTTYIVIVYSP
jgi:hypothetical protein